uniref:Uncharacterized protein n=1 Tax=Caudovirales sp. ctGAB12 TaxID=2827632 RepID=A0A8S5SPK2_9CAUD|nr:MAG TPA: hypothetical protein [Caudovirales sp. ctGAB12]
MTPDMKKAPRQNMSVLKRMWGVCLYRYITINIL